MNARPLEWWELIQVDLFLRLVADTNSQSTALALGVALDRDTYINDPERWRNLRSDMERVGKGKQP